MNYHKINAFLSGLYGFTGTLKEFIGRGKFSVPLISNEGGGVYVSQSTVFLQHKLMLGVYVRNTVNSHDLPTGVKRSIKIVISKGTQVTAGGYSYAKSGTDDELYSELGTSEISYIAAFLHGFSSSCTVEGAGASLSITKGPSDVVLSLEKAGKKLSMPLSCEALFELRSNIAKYCLLLHPELPADLSLRFLAESSGVLSNQLNNSAVQPISSSVEYPSMPTPSAEDDNPMYKLHQSLSSVNDIVTLELVLGSLFDEPASDKTKKCLWAIGNQKWKKGEKGLIIIQCLQNEAGERLCRQIVESANNGNLDILDLMYERVG